MGLQLRLLVQHEERPPTQPVLKGGTTNTCMASSEATPAELLSKQVLSVIWQC